MFDFNDPSIVVQMCKFQAYIEKAHIVIKFPCSYFVQWKTINNRYSICTQKRVRTANDEAIFNEKLTFYTEMVYNAKKKQYYSKQTFLVLNLVSKSRPDQVKLVGRISVDLAQVLNRKRYEQVTRMRLNYCSVEGSIVFGIGLINRRDSNLSVKDLDRSAFTDYFSLNPINRMMIEESLINSSGSYNHNSSNNNGLGQNRSLDKAQIKRDHPQQIRSQQQLSQKSRQQQYHTVPSFGIVTQHPYPSHNNNNPPNPQSCHPQHHHLKDQQIISFHQNSQQLQQQEELVDRVINNQSPRTNYSREQSLIEKLEEKNFRPYERGICERANYERGNVVEVSSRQPRTDRTAGDNSHNNNYNNGTSGYSVGNSAQKGSKGNIKLNNQQPESGQIKRQLTPLTKPPSQPKLPPPQPLAKPTSPPSYQRQLIRLNSSSQKLQKFSEASQFQNQQLLSIVQKLQHEKQQQESMIQSLKAMLANKNMKKKEGLRMNQLQQSQIQYNNSNRQKKDHSEILLNKQKQIVEENTQLRKENQRLNKQYERVNKQLQKKDQDSRQKHMHVFELLDKIKKIQTELSTANDKIRTFEDQISRLQLKEIENQQICQSLKLQLSSQAQKQPLINQSMVTDLLFKHPTQFLDSFKSIPSHSFKQLYPYLKPSHQQSFQLLTHNQQQQQQQQFKITISKDANIYDQLQKQNMQLTDRVKQLQEQVQIYKDLLKQQNSSQKLIIKQSLPVITIPPHYQVMTTSNVQNDQVPFTITVSRNTNIYQNYQNLEQENTQLYDRIKELEEEVQGYRQLMRQENYPNGQKKQNIPNVMLESVQVQDMGQYQTSIKNINHLSNNNTQSLKRAKNQNQLNSLLIQNISSQITSPSPSISSDIQQQVQTFKIILTKDKDIYKQQQEQNIELSKRVIELEQEMQRYKQLLRNQNNNQTVSRSSTLKQAATEQQQHYQQQGLTITLTQDKNVFQNQQQQLHQYEEQVKQLQQIIQRYKLLYGSIDANPKYRVSITRQQRIYQDQEMEIRQLMKMLQMKDDEVMGLMGRLSILERELEEVRQGERMGERLRENSHYCNDDNNNSGEIRINVVREENIYQEQEKDITELSQRVIQLEEKLAVMVQQLHEKQTLLNKAQSQLASITKPITKPITPTTLPPATQPTPPTLTCPSCITLQTHTLELQTTLKLTQQQKNLLQDQIGTLQQQKFCLTSTQNQLKITIQDLRDQINLLGQQNERLIQEVHYLTGRLEEMEEGNQVGEDRVMESRYSEKGIRHEENRGKLTITLPQNVFRSHKYPLQLPKSPTNHLLQQQLSQTPKSPHSPKPSQLLLSLQQQNSHLRQSLSTFEQQLQEQYVTIGELQQRISRLMHEKEILFERDQQLNKEIIALKQHEQQNNKKQISLKKRITELQKQVPSLKQQPLTTITTNNIPQQQPTNQTTLLKQHISQLQNQLQTLKIQHSLTKLAHQSSSISIQQLREKQLQIQQLQQQLQHLNQSLSELSISYQSLQRNLLSLEQEKQAEVQSIRQQYETVNRMLKEDLESIEQIIGEKQKICEENSLELKERAKDVERLVNQLEQMRKEHFLECNTLKGEISSLMQQNQSLKTKLSTLNQSYPHPPLQQPTHKTNLLTALNQIKLSKSQKQLQLSKLIPLITEKLNEKQLSKQTYTYNEEQLAKNIAKQIQKIKINIMKNYQTTSSVVGGVIHRISSVKTAKNSQEFKTFAEKSAILNYLKPIEEIIKGY